MADRLAGRRALVYGGGTGIGLACAEAFAAAGASVFLTGRRAGRIEAAASRIAVNTGAKAGHEAGDATIPEDVERVTAAALRFLGGLDIVLVSCGAAGAGSIFDTSVAEFRRICDTNLLSAFPAKRAAAPHLVASGHASVIAIASMLWCRRTARPRRLLHIQVRRPRHGACDSARSFARGGAGQCHQSRLHRSRTRIQRSSPSAQPGAGPGRAPRDASDPPRRKARGDRRCRGVSRERRIWLRHRPDDQRRRRLYNSLGGRGHSSAPGCRGKSGFPRSRPLDLDGQGNDQASPYGRPTSWTPISRQSTDHPSGNEIAGCPVMLNEYANEM
jgi:NAD(P)-dependent dehydrogenase (short-subunit alcohol dehydrogenase family)